MMRRVSINTILFIVMLMVFNSVGLAAKRGTSGSTERSEWCKAKLEQCKKNGEANCKSWHPQDNTSYMICTTDEYLACKNAYGSSSDCQTRESSIGKQGLTKQGELKVSPDATRPPETQKAGTSGFIRK